MAAGRAAKPVVAAAAARSATLPPRPPPSAAAAKARDGRADGAAGCRRLRLLHWNILDGGGRRLEGIGAVVRDGGYDLVTLNELNGIGADQLRGLARRWGFPHSELLQKSHYHIGLLSMHPLRLQAKDVSGQFAHGLLCVDVLSLTLCLTHLNPHDVRRRLGEARAIAQRVPSGRAFLLAGDLNTLSALDQAAHERAGLAQLIRNGPHAAALSRKFLDASHARIDYSPMQALLEAPLHDVGVDSGPTVPTRINADRMHFAQLRLDYVLVNERMRASCGQAEGLRAAVVRDERTDGLSDHFPLTLSFAVLPGGVQNVSSEAG